MTEQHVPVDRLAAYAAGDLDATAALEVEAHVLLCTDCRSDVEAVQRVTNDLAAVPAVTMPAEVAARVDAALAAARDAESTPATGPAGDVLPMRPRRRPSFAGVAAVAAGVALFAAVGVPLLTDGGDAPRTAAESGAGSEGGVTTRRLESGLEYKAEAAQETLLRALGGTRDTTAFASGNSAAADAAPRGAAKSRASSAAVEMLELTVLQTDAGRLAACVDALAESQPGIGRTPLVVDYGTFEGRPALIVVFPTVRQGTIRPDRVDFWAVGPRCGITPGDDDVLHFERFERPAGL